MGRIVVLLGLFGMFSSLAWADTTFVATGSVAGFWDRNGSPYVVQGDLEIAAGAVLHIGSGVRVYFDAPGRPRMVVNGMLDVRGELADSVYFTTDTLLWPERWGGVHFFETTDTSVMRYCVFENGRSREPNDAFAPLRMQRAMCRLEHCAIRSNLGGNDGGAAYIRESWIRIADCLWEDNLARRFGGAIELYGNSPECVIERTVFVRNTADYGGAVVLYGETGMTIRECGFFENYAARWGGAIECENGAGSFEGCTIQRNSAVALGGGVAAISNGNYNFSDCLIDSNSAEGGGGFYLESNSEIERCLISRNRADYGGGIYSSGFTPRVTRCTVVKNSGNGISNLGNPGLRIISTVIAYTTSGVALLNPPLAAQALRNCAFFGNAGGNFLGSRPVGLEAMVQANANGDSCDYYFNLFMDPLFADTAMNDYSPGEDSPLIDAGNSPPLLELDPDSTIADIGAYFYPHETHVTDDQPELAQQVSLGQNYPNPFNAATRIEFTIGHTARVALRVYDLLGREVAVIANDFFAAGGTRVEFAAEDLASGIYFYRLETAGLRVTKKMVVLR